MLAGNKRESDMGIAIAIVGVAMAVIGAIVQTS